MTSTCAEGRLWAGKGGKGKVTPCGSGEIDTWRIVDGDKERKSTARKDAGRPTLACFSCLGLVGPGPRGWEEELEEEGFWEIPLEDCFLRDEVGGSVRVLGTRAQSTDSEEPGALEGPPAQMGASALMEKPREGDREEVCLAAPKRALSLAQEIQDLKSLFLDHAWMGAAEDSPHEDHAALNKGECGEGPSDFGMREVLIRYGQFSDRDVVSVPSLKRRMQKLKELQKELEGILWRHVRLGEGALARPEGQGSSLDGPSLQPSPVAKVRLAASCAVDSVDVLVDGILECRLRSGRTEESRREDNTGNGRLLDDVIAAVSEFYFSCYAWDSLSMEKREVTPSRFERSISRAEALKMRRQTQP